FALEAFAGFEADERGFAVGVELDGEDFGEADGGFAGVGVVDDDLLAGLHVAERDERLWVLDAVPGGFAVAEEVVEGVGVGFGFEEVGHVKKAYLRAKAPFFSGGL